MLAQNIENDQEMPWFDSRYTRKIEINLKCLFLAFPGHSVTFHGNNY